MSTLHIPPNLDLYYLVDDYTDPWCTPETILLLHGNAESSAAWYAWVPQLAHRYRLEGKKALRRVKKVGNFHIFEAAISREAAQRRLIDDLLALFGGRTQPVMAHLIESGKLTLEDVQEAEKTLRKLARKDKPQ